MILRLISMVFAAQRKIGFKNIEAELSYAPHDLKSKHLLST